MLKNLHKQTKNFGKVNLLDRLHYSDVPFRVGSSQIGGLIYPMKIEQSRLFSKMLPLSHNFRKINNLQRI